MAIQLLRGHVKDISSPDKRGAVGRRRGKYNIKIYGDWVSGIGKGDGVLLPCEQHSANIKPCSGIDEGGEFEIKRRSQAVTSL